MNGRHEVHRAISNKIGILDIGIQVIKAVNSFILHVPTSLLAASRAVHVVKLKLRYDLGML